jgi:hypothetical protein
MLSLPIKAVFEDPSDVCTAILMKGDEIVATLLADETGDFGKVDVEPGKYMVRVTQNGEPSAFDHDDKGRCSGRMPIELEPEWFDALEARVDELERRVAAFEALDRLMSAQEALAARPETVMPDFEPEAKQESYDEPPAEIADLIDPDLTARQNLNALTAKFAAAKNLEEYCRSNDDMEGAMKHLRDAERFESGIKWNRAVLAEVV